MNHEWKDTGPIYEGAGRERGSYWICGKCSMSIRSNDEPRSLRGFVRFKGPGNWFDSDVSDDCDVEVVKKIMQA